VPADVMNAGRKREIAFPTDAVTHDPGELEAVVFRDVHPVSRPTELQLPRIFPSPLSKKVRRYDRYTVPGAGLVNTGIVLRPGDDFEIRAKGLVDVGGPGQFPPSGKRVKSGWDRNFPLNAMIDPSHPNRYALIGYLNNFFFIGRHLRRQKWNLPQERELRLLVNDDYSIDNTGEFEVYVTVWGPDVPIRSARFVDCARRDDTDPDRAIDLIGGIKQTGQRWSAKIDDAVRLLNNGVLLYVLTPGGGLTEVYAVEGDSDTKPHLRTSPTPGGDDNLNELPECRNS
jgi:hypothetical protein